MNIQRLPFIAKHLPAFRELRQRIDQLEPMLIIAIARKGPRLGELSAKFDSLIFPPNVPVFSHKALPFFGRGALKGYRVIVFDDSVIWGSTMKDVLTSPALEGAQATPVVLAACKTRDQSLIPGLLYVVDMGAQESAAFSTEIVEAFRLLAKPYNVDHPILEMHGTSLSRLTEEDICAAAQSSLHAQVFRLTHPFQRRNGIFNLALNRPDLFGWHAACAMIPQPLHLFKIRVFRDSASNVLRVEPILVFRVKREHLLSGQFFIAELFPSLQDICKDATDLILRNVPDEKEQLRALYRLQMYLGELPLGLLFLQWLNEVFSIEIPNLEEILPSFDVELVFGQLIGQRIRQNNTLLRELQAARQGSYQISLPAGIMSSEEPRHRAWGAEFERLFNRTKARLQVSLSPNWALEDNVSYLLCALHDLDTSTRVQGSYQRGRLDFGYTFDEIGEILTRFGIEFENHHLSATIDYLVDAGVAVPLVKPCEDGLVDRMYRFGEALSALDRLRYAVRTAVSELIDRLNRRTKQPVQALPLLLTDKALALMARVGQFTGQLPMEDLAIRLAYGRYGVDTEVQDVLTEGRLLQWAVADGILSQDGRRLRLNKRFDQRCPPSDNPLNMQQQELISQIMLWFVDASIETKDSANRYQTALTVTTCNNAANTIEAIKAEIRRWFADSRINIHGCLDELYGLTQLLRDQVPTTIVLEAAKELDKRCQQGPADVMNQSELKLQVFRNLPHVQEQLRTLYSRAQKPGLDNFYQFKVDPLLNPSTTEREKRELQVLDRFGRLCQSSTSVIRSCSSFVRKKLSAHPRPAPELERAVKDTNACADELGKVSPALWIATRLSMPIPPKDGELSIEALLEPVQSSLLTLLKELESLARTTILAEVEADLVPLPNNVYIVMYDWIHSTDTGDDYLVAQQRHQLNAQVVPFAREHLGEANCGPTGDDANAFVLGTLPNALRLTNRIIESLENMGRSARISVSSTVGRQRLFFDNKYKTYSGNAFVLAARIRDYFKGESWMGDGRSHVFMDEVVVDELKRSGESSECFRPLTREPVELRGEGLPRVQIYEYDYEHHRQSY